MNKLDIDNFTDGILAQARQTYGNKNQILVCMEELNELACVLAKYPRYTDEHEATMELYDKVLDEVADVAIILKHVMEIFKITDEALDARIYNKTTRLLRWLMHSSSMQETIDDRAVGDEQPEATTKAEKSMHTNYCVGCKWQFNPNQTYSEYMENCKPCYMAQATEGKAPYYTAR